MTDNPTILAINKAYERRIEYAKAQAPVIAEELLRKKRTLAQAIHSAQWHYHGFLQLMIVDRLHELHAARETAPAPLKPRISSGKRARSGKSAVSGGKNRVGIAISRQFPAAKRPPEANS